MTSRYRHRRSATPSTPFPVPLEPGEIAVNTANRQIAAGNVADGVPLDLIAVRFFDQHAIYKVDDVVDYNGNLFRATVPNGPGAFNGANWTSNGTQVIFSDTAPPLTALDGSFFWETDTGTLYVLYNDGNSRQWVIASPQPDPSTFVLRAGDTMGGALTLFGDPTAAMMAATKQYVDAINTALVSGKVSKGGDTMSGALLVPVKGNTMGLAGGTAATGAVVPADASIKFYSIDANNWGGVGVDNNGTVWFRAGLTGTPIPLLTLGTDQIARFAQPPLAPTPAPADNSTKAATTAFVANAMLAAAPLDILGYSGLQLNGSFEVSEERAVATAFTANGYVCDCWSQGITGTFVASSQVTPAGSGFGNVWQTNITTAQPSIGAGDLHFVNQVIEGYRARRLAFAQSFAQPVTIAFYSAHHRTGTYSVALRNGAATRSCVLTYNQAVADSYQWNVLTFPGDQAGAWDVTNGGGLQLTFTNASGATYTAPAVNTWYGANYIAAPGQVNGVGTTADVFRIMNVMVLPGIYAPLAGHQALMMRPYDEELIKCKRYWQKIGGDAVNDLMLIANYTTNTAAAHFTIVYPVEMRAIPAPSLVGAWSFINCTFAAWYPGKRSLLMANTPTVAAGLAYVSNSVGQYLALNARL